MTRLRDRRDRRILLEAARRPVSAVEAERIVTKGLFGSCDPAIHGLRTRAALTRLDRQGLLARTPDGWTATNQGRALLAIPAAEAARHTAF
ncbi:hypothetical protein [Brevundimonas sp.]|uniref:hypothetical protein n=1 Tax=Brevundimonas sp. TaxID=1871086 RepID=UPI002898A643|nr:hypothetical protein [Brevundimonas sp.]